MRVRSSVRMLAAVVVVAMLAACGPPPDTPSPRPGQAPAAAPLPPPLPDETGWGVHALVARRSPAGDLWVGTYDRGIYVLRRGEREWQHITPVANATTPPGARPVNSFAFQGDSIVWYGTAGAGFGASANSGRTWQRWGAELLGGRWQHVAHNGLRASGDTVYVATSDGVRITADGGASWRCIQARAPVSAGGDERPDGCTERVAGLPSPYALSLALDPRGTLWVGHLAGLSFSRDAGRSWTDATAGVTALGRVRAAAVGVDSVLWVATEQDVFVDSAGAGTLRAAPPRLTGWDRLPGAVREIVAGPAGIGPAFATSHGLVASDAEQRYRVYYLAAGETYRPAADIWHLVWWGPPLWPIGAAATGLNRILAGETRFPTPPRATIVAQPEPAARPWLARPIADQPGSNPYVDATRPFGSASAGPLDARDGINFNNPAGTSVRAAAAGRVVFAGPTGDGSNTVALLHDLPADGRSVFTTYHHNRSIGVSVGQSVAAGDVIAEVGNTGSAAGERLHFRVHVASSPDVAPIVNPPDGVPADAVNPQLWVEPLPGTGVVAGRVLGADGQPVPRAKIFGLVMGYPDETPFSFVETYAEARRSDPAYGDSFAIGDVPAGDYTIGVEIDGNRLWRRVVVAAGMVTRVEFRP